MPTAMKSGPITKEALTLAFPAALLLAGAMALLSGCDRTTPADTSAPKSTLPQESAAPKSGTDAAANMVRIAGGRFVMGDKTQGDAPPHEVVVSSFFMDRFLVAQESYQKMLGKNP